MSLRDVAREFKELPLSLLNQPQLDARMSRDPEQLEELASDIAKRGVILPLAVVRDGERYEIVDGFRRFLAAMRAQLATVPCMVYPTKDLALEGVKYAANLFREDMSAAEEATFFHELFEKECEQDIDRVAALVNKTRGYVDARLQLILGDDEVFEAVRAKKIPIGVAAQLNKITEQDYRRFYLAHAIKGGATVTVVAAWVSEWKAMYATRVDTPAPTAPASGPTVESAYDPHRCYICGESDPRHVPEQLSVHSHCRLAVLDKLLRAYHGLDEKVEA